MTTTTLRTLSDKYLNAVLERNSHHAREVIDGALADGVPVPDVYLEILQPALYELGDRWAAGRVNVAYEHYATAVTERLIAELATRMRVPPTGGRLAVIACTPGEEHELGARMLTDFLESDAWEVALLGPSTPARDLVDLVEEEMPDVVALSTSTATHLGDARDTVARLAALKPRPYIVVGGLAWSRGRAPEGADRIVQDARELVDVLRERFPPIDE